MRFEWISILQQHSIYQQHNVYNDEHEWDPLIRFAAFLYTRWKIVCLALLIFMIGGIWISNAFFQKNKANYIFTEKSGSAYASLNNVLNPDSWKKSVGLATGSQITSYADYSIISKDQIFDYFISSMKNSLISQQKTVDNQSFTYKIASSRNKKSQARTLTIITNGSPSLFDKLIKITTFQAQKDVNSFIISAAESEKINTVKALTSDKKAYKNNSTTLSNTNSVELIAIAAQLKSLDNYEISKINIKPYLVYQDEISKPSSLLQAIIGAVSGILFAMTLIFIWFVIYSIEWRKITEYQTPAVK